MGRLEKFERQQRVKKMKETKAAERSANQQKATEQFKTITQAVGRYKNWAMSRSTGKGRALACAAPVLAPLVLLIGLGMAAPSPEPEAQTAKPVEAGTEKAPLPASDTVKAESVEVEASPEPGEPAEETPAPAPDRSAMKSKSRKISGTIRPVFLRSKLLTRYLRRNWQTIFCRLLAMRLPPISQAM